MKTIEEAAIECANTYVKGNRDFYPSNEGDFIDAFEAGVEFAQRWISVEDELPPLGVPVICRYNMFDKEYYWTGTFYTKERIMHFVKKHLKITHFRLIELI